MRVVQFGLFLTGSVAGAAILVDFQVIFFVTFAVLVFRFVESLQSAFHVFQIGFLDDIWNTMKSRNIQVLVNVQEHAVT